MIGNNFENFTSFSKFLIIRQFSISKEQQNILITECAQILQRQMFWTEDLRMSLELLCINIIFVKVCFSWMLNCYLNSIWNLPCAHQKHHTTSIFFLSQPVKAFFTSIHPVFVLSVWSIKGITGSSIKRTCKKNLVFMYSVAYSFNFPECLLNETESVSNVLHLDLRANILGFDTSSLPQCLKIP